MTLFLNHVRHDYEFPARTTPAWATSVERWPQLDAYAYGLSELFQNTQLAHRPDLIVLASSEASNQTDLAFVQTGAVSPSKFVHTLPNSRSAALLQVMAWSGPLLCLQDDPQTVTSALAEAVSFVCHEEKRVWLFSVERHHEYAYTAHLFDVFCQTPLPGERDAQWTIEKSSAQNRPLSSDREFFARLQSPGLSNGIMVFNDLQMTLKDEARG